MRIGMKMILITSALCVLLSGCTGGISNETPKNTAGTADSVDVTETGTEESTSEGTTSGDPEVDVRKACAKAFLEKDTGTLCAMSGMVNIDGVSIEEMLSELESIEFGNYSADKDPGPDKLAFFFEITASDCSYFPVGEYVYDITVGGPGPAGAVTWNDRAVIECPEEYSFPCSLARTYTQYSFAYSHDFEDGICDEAVFFDILSLHAKEAGSLVVPAEYMKNAAHDLFGLTDYVPPETVASLGDEGYSSLVLGGLIMKCDLMRVEEDGDSVSFVYQLYADACGIVRSHTVKVTFDAAENELGYTFSSAKIIEAGKYDPYGYHV